MAKVSLAFLGICTCSNVTTDGKVVCFTTGSTKIIASILYLRPIPRFGTCMVITYLLMLTTDRGLRMRLATIRCFTKAMKYGNKFIYQTVPRLLTIWLDMGEDPAVRSDECFTKITAEISRAINGVPAFKVSSSNNICHPLSEPHLVVYRISANCISCWPSLSTSLRCLGASHINRDQGIPSTDPLVVRICRKIAQ